MRIQDIISQSETIVLIKDQMLISYIDCFYNVYFEVPEINEYEFTQAFPQTDYVPFGTKNGLLNIDTIKNGAIILSQQINKGEIEL